MSVGGSRGPEEWYGGLLVLLVGEVIPQWLGGDSVRVTSSLLGWCRGFHPQRYQGLQKEGDPFSLPYFILEMVTCTDGTLAVHLAHDADNGALDLCGPSGFSAVGAIDFPLIEEDTEGLRASGLCRKHLE